MPDERGDRKQTRFVRAVGSEGPRVVRAVNELVARARAAGDAVFFTRDVRPDGDPPDHPANELDARRLADEDLLAPPWTVATAADLLAALISPQTIGALLHDRGWTTAQAATHYGVMLTRALTSGAPVTPAAR